MCFTFLVKLPVPENLSEQDVDYRSKFFCDRIQEQIVLDLDDFEKSDPTKLDTISLVICFLGSSRGFISIGSFPVPLGPIRKNAVSGPQKLPMDMQAQSSEDPQLRLSWK